MIQPNDLCPHTLSNQMPIFINDNTKTDSYGKKTEQYDIVAKIYTKTARAKKKNNRSTMRKMNKPSMRKNNSRTLQNI